MLELVEMMGSLESQSCKKGRDEVVPDLFRGQAEVTDCAEGRKSLVRGIEGYRVRD